MSQYLVLNRINIQNANCIAGFTWGFPAITNFLGFTHALQRKLSNDYNIEFDGCGVISHDYQLQVYKPKPKANFEFIQSKFSYTFKPKFEKGRMKDPSIIEEGKMNLTASLVIKFSKELLAKEEKIKDFKSIVLEHCLANRLAGGVILSVARVDLFSASTEKQQEQLIRKVKRLCMPGFVLMDRSEYLKKHFGNLIKSQPDTELLDAWLDFSAMKYQAIPKSQNDDETSTYDTDADWERVPKPGKGWSVPLMVGYKAISREYKVGEIKNTRHSDADSTVIGTRFVEAVHSVGEWKSLHRINNFDEIIWAYQAKDDWYLCTQNKISTTSQQLVDKDESETLNFADALANL